MASVMKIFSNLKSGHLHSKKSSLPTQSKDTPAKEDTDGGPNDLLNRRRVSISKSGRYRENHKKRMALRDTSNNDDDDTRQKDEKNKENQKNKENERNQLNWTATTTTTTKRGESEQHLDGHAVADEIATLAKTIENGGGSKADLATT